MSKRCTRYATFIWFPIILIIITLIIKQDRRRLQLMYEIHSTRRIPCQYVIRRIPCQYVIRRIPCHYVIMRIPCHYVIRRIPCQYVIRRIPCQYVTRRIPCHYVIMRIPCHYVIRCSKITWHICGGFLSNLIRMFS